MPHSYRTFIAVEIPTEVVTQVERLIGRLGQSSANVKWVEQGNLHLTLKFLGDVEVISIPEVCKAVSTAVANLPAFEVELAGVGAFPNVEKPRTVWLGVEKGRDELVELHDGIDGALADLGFRSEGRRFTPHLTLGRVRQRSDGSSDLIELIAQHDSFVAGKMTVDEIAVVSSKMGRDGPVYTMLGHVELA